MDELRLLTSSFSADFQPIKGARSRVCIIAARFTKGPSAIRRDSPEGGCAVGWKSCNGVRLSCAIVRVFVGRVHEHVRFTAGNWPTSAMPCNTSKCPVQS